MSSCVEYTLRIFNGCDHFIEIIHSDDCFIRNFLNSEVFYSVEISRISSLKITEHSNEYFKTDGNLKFATPCRCQFCQGYTVRTIQRIINPKKVDESATYNKPFTKSFQILFLVGKYVKILKK